VPEEDALVRLARITRVEAHKRRSKTGQTEQVDSYLRKILDKFGGTDSKTKKGAFSSESNAPSAPAAPKVHPEYQPRVDAANEAEKRAQADYDAIGKSPEFKSKAAGLKTIGERESLINQLHAAALKSGKAKSKKDYEKEILKKKGLKPMTFDTFMNYYKGR
jgi:phage I-like protein